MFASDQATLTIAGVSIAEVRWFAIDADRAGFFFPFDDAVVGNIAAQQITAVAEPHRSLSPAQAGRDPLDG